MLFRSWELLWFTLEMFLCFCPFFSFVLNDFHNQREEEETKENEEPFGKSLKRWVISRFHDKCRLSLLSLVKSVLSTGSLA